EAATIVAVPVEPPAATVSAVAPVSDVPETPETPASPIDADLWQRVRQGFAIAEIDNRTVDVHEQWYAKRPDYMDRMFERASRYLYYIVEEVEKRGMPTELALLPFIESAFNPHANSPAKAAGMWQFIPSTAKHYGLQRSVFLDERRDVIAST